MPTLKTRQIVAVASLFLVAACGPTTDSLACNNAPNKSCATVTVTGGTITPKTCMAGELVTSCATTGVIGRCSIPGLPAGSTCPESATCTNGFVVYTDGDVTAAQAACTSVSGTWSTN